VATAPGKPVVRKQRLAKTASSSVERDMILCNGFRNREGGAVSAPEFKIAAQLARELAKIHETVESALLLQIRSLLLPIIENVRQEKCQQEKSTRKYNRYLDILLKHIEDISSGFATRLQIQNALSMTEVRIALLVKNDFTNEEIAEYLHITPETVKTHRRNIRRKLGITGKKSELNAYLQTLTFT
jgi:DNA-binding CsgD family transcriptional regulator